MYMCNITKLYEKTAPQLIKLSLFIPGHILYNIVQRNIELYYPSETRI